LIAIAIANIFFLPKEGSWKYLRFFIEAGCILSFFVFTWKGRIDDANGEREKKEVKKHMKKWFIVLGCGFVLIRVLVSIREQLN